MSAHLIVDGIVKRWPDRLVEASFEVAPGEAVALVGPSGSGKSTVLRVIAGLVKPDAGRVLIDGVDATGLAPGKRGVGMVFQDRALFAHLSVEDNVGYGLVSAGMSRRAARAEAAAWLARVSLAGFGKRRVDTLSGGEAQRVALARALAVGPALVLFDEPLAALDAPLRRRLRAELARHQREIGYAAVYVTHDEEEAAELASRRIALG